jgi:hypothetical protein
MRTFFKVFIPSYKYLKSSHQGSSSLERAPMISVVNANLKMRHVEFDTISEITIGQGGKKVSKVEAFRNTKVNKTMGEVNLKTSSYLGGEYHNIEVRVLSARDDSSPNKHAEGLLPPLPTAMKEKVTESNRARRRASDYEFGYRINTKSDARPSPGSCKVLNTDSLKETPSPAALSPLANKLNESPCSEKYHKLLNDNSRESADRGHLKLDIQDLCSGQDKLMEAEFAHRDVNERDQGHCYDDKNNMSFDSNDEHYEVLREELYNEINRSDSKSGTSSKNVPVKTNPKPSSGKIDLDNLKLKYDYDTEFHLPSFPSIPPTPDQATPKPSSYLLSSYNHKEEQEEILPQPALDKLSSGISLTGPPAHKMVIAESTKICNSSSHHTNTMKGQILETNHTSLKNSSQPSQQKQLILGLNKLLRKKHYNESKDEENRSYLANVRNNLFKESSRSSQHHSADLEGKPSNAKTAKFNEFMYSSFIKNGSTSKQESHSKHPKVCPLQNLTNPKQGATIMINKLSESKELFSLSFTKKDQSESNKEPPLRFYKDSLQPESITDYYKSKSVHKHSLSEVPKDPGPHKRSVSAQSQTVDFSLEWAKPQPREDTSKNLDSLIDDNERLIDKITLNITSALDQAYRVRAAKELHVHQQLNGPIKYIYGKDIKGKMVSNNSNKHLQEKKIETIIRLDNPYISRSVDKSTIPKRHCAMVLDTSKLISVSKSIDALTIGQGNKAALSKVRRLSDVAVPTPTSYIARKKSISPKYTNSRQLNCGEGTCAYQHLDRCANPLCWRNQRQKSSAWELRKKQQG